MMEQNISSMKPNIIDLIRDMKNDRSKMERYVRNIKNFNKEWESRGYGSSNQGEGKYLWGQKISIKPELKIADAFNDLEYPPVHNYFESNNIEYIEDINEQVLVELLFENQVGQKGYFGVLDKLFGEETQENEEISASIVNKDLHESFETNGFESEEYMSEDRTKLVIGDSIDIVGGEPMLNELDIKKELWLDIKEDKEKARFIDDEGPIIDLAVVDELNNKIRGIYTEYEKGLSKVSEYKQLIKSLIEDIDNKDLQINTLRDDIAKARQEIIELDALNKDAIINHNFEVEGLTASITRLEEDFQRTKKELKAQIKLTEDKDLEIDRFLTMAAHQERESQKLLEAERMDKDILTSKLEAAERETVEYKDLFEAQINSEQEKIKQIEELNYKIYELEEINRINLKVKDTEISDLMDQLREKEKEFEHFGTIKKLVENLSNKLASK